MLLECIGISEKQALGRTGDSMKLAYSAKDMVYFNQCAICTLSIYKNQFGKFTVKASMMNGELINLYSADLYEDCKEFLTAYVAKLNKGVE